MKANKMVSVLLLFCFISCMFYSDGNDTGKNCSEYFNHKEKIISNLSWNMTTSNETCNYEIIAPTGQQVEILFDVNFRYQMRCSPPSTADYGIFISYSHTDQTRYYDVICDSKSAYLVRSVGRRLYLKFVLNYVPFMYRGIYRFVQSTNCILFECLNGGTCIVTNGQRFCICPPGLSGFTCSECANFKCYNGGSCIMSKNNKPHCVCGINFEGRFCERNRNPCLSNPCLFGRCEIITSSDTLISSKTDRSKYRRITANNNLTSKQIFHDQLSEILRGENHNSFRCTCYPGYSGVRCDQDTKQCESYTCLPGKDSSQGVGNPKCYCDECVFGLCVMVNDSMHCRCFPGFTGDNCSQNVDECEKSPCVYGDCVDFVNGFVCSCNENYTGKTCNVSVRDKTEHWNSTDVCTIHTCENGVCMKQKLEVTCHCYRGFTGKRCEIPVTFLVPTNNAFSSRKHRCFEKRDVIEICNCISKVCMSNKTAFQNTTFCNTLKLLSLLNEFCSEGNFSSVCVSYFEMSIVLLLRFLCVRKQKDIPKIPDRNNTTKLFPFQEKEFLHSSYLLRCKLSNNPDMIDVLLLQEVTSFEFVRPVYVYSECYINSTDHFEVPNCLIKTISFHFNMTWISSYFKSVYIVMTLIEKLRSERLGTGTPDTQGGFYNHQTLHMSLEILFLSFDNETQFLKTHTSGNVTYMCEQKCNESFCCKWNKMSPEIELRTKSHNSGNISNVCTCPSKEKENLCHNLRDDGGNQKSYTFVYLIISLTIILIILILGSTCVCFKRSRLRGKAEFPQLLYIPPTLDSNVPSKTTAENFPEDVERSRPKLMTSRDIFMENKKLFRVNGAETGKSEA